MSPHNPQISFLFDLAKAKTVLSRRLDNRLGLHGLGFSDFMILYFLGESPDEKMRRSDLAEKIGLTASGVTRMLLPMEKIGLVKREVSDHDARVSYVLLAPGGKRLLTESMERVEILAEELLPKSKFKHLDELSEILIELGKTVVY